VSVEQSYTDEAFHTKEKCNMNAIETQLFSRGFVRCPNDISRWYAGGPSIMNVEGTDIHLRYDLDHYRNGRIVVVPQPWLRGGSWCTVVVEPVATFDTVEEFDTWRQENGTPSQGGHSYGSE
jgi:hypothetical protein